MGSVFRATYTKALPVGAELFTRKGKRYARWEDARGKRRTAPTTASDRGVARIVLESRLYTAKYRDGENRVVKVPTSCRTKDAAKAVLTELEARADKVRSGSWTASEDGVLDHQNTPIGEHVDAYLAHLARKRVRGRVVSPRHCANVRRSLSHLIGDCGFERLRDLNRDAVESWARDREAAGMAPRTINTRLVAIPPLETGA